ncbi:hypothetical protein GCM10008995_03380 [Halobellus salinus]|uniref:Coiled-coil protein n=1 Tax=Halobellus salinus TaxID=931585 RepID=A0A830EE98_9EURY|nr:hypothetical protein [Halobellus salinus]GGI96677.1 hypothetical protein GCM10008995_03380 [Halobellus salinus]SMP13380.1 hypothetical protein SAMN06265347_104187 [Halobellus salinus]
MNSTRRDALTAGGVVTALAAAGVAVFLFSGSSDAVLFFIAGVPVVLILGGVAWHRRETRSSGTTSPRIESMTDDLADDVEELFVTYRRLETETPWDPSAHADSVQGIKRDLENRGFEITTGGDTVDVTVTDYPMGMGALSQHRTAVRDARDALESEYRADIDAQIEAMSDQIDRLIDGNLLDPSAAGAVADAPAVGADPGRLAGVLGDRRKTFQDLLDDAESKVHSVTGERVVEWSAVEGRIAAGQYEAAAEHVLDPDGATPPDPGPKKAELLELIDTVESSVAAQYADPARFETLGEVRGEIEAIDSAYEVDELDERLRPRALRASAEVLTDMREELTGYIEQFSRSNVPDGFFERPGVLDRSLESELRGASDLDAFRTLWTGMADDLAAALDTAGERDGALRAYDDVVNIVERALATDGEVTESDVPYDPAEPIMRLYAHRNPEVGFMPGRPALTQDTEVIGQQFGLAVDVQLDPPETRDVTVAVTIRDETHRRTRTLEGSGRIGFDGILGGQATVAASADDDRFGSRETELTLDRDRTVNLQLSEETAIERLCAGVETNAELLLTEVEDDITARYESEQYLTDGMDLGVQDEYTQCVLALWADNAGLSVQVETDSVLVYDRQRMQNQLVDLTEQRVGDAGELAYETMRERFLKPPASDALIRDILAQAELSIDVELTDDKVVSA